MDPGGIRTEDRHLEDSPDSRRDRSQSDLSHLRRHRRALSGASESDRAKRSRDRRPRLSSRSGAGSDLGAGTGSYTKDYRDDREAHWEAAGRMALLHPKPQQPATADGERLSLEQQFVFLRLAVSVGAR